MSSDSRLTAAALLQEALAQAPDTPRSEIEYLIAHTMNIHRLELPAQGNARLSRVQVTRLRRAIARLAAGEPSQYVIGHVNFMGLTIQTDRRALIPRPETEELVEQVENCATLWQAHNPRILDLGTGSGCIAIALAVRRPQACILATDISPSALALASENAAQHELLPRLVFRRNRLLENMPPATFDAVISNPPYIPSATLAGLDRSVRKFEPRLALDGGPDGLAVIRPLLQQAWTCLKPGGYLFLEIGCDQWPAVAALLQTSGCREHAVHADRAGRNRVVAARKPAPQ